MDARDKNPLTVIDATFGDGHKSSLATGLRTEDKEAYCRGDEQSGLSLHGGLGECGSGFVLI